MLQLPDPRGEVSRALLAALVREPQAITAPQAPIPADPLSDEDLQIEGRFTRSLLGAWPRAGRCWSASSAPDR